MPDDNTNNMEDDFLSGFESDLQGSSSIDGADPFASFDNSVSGSVDPLASLDEVPKSSSSAIIPVEEESSVAEPVLDPESIGKGKKGKKGKTPKASKKEKLPKARKEKAPKAPKKEKAPKSGYVASPAPVFLLLILLIVALAAANAFAFMTAGASCATYLIVLDVLGLFALLVPIMLLSHLRQRPISLFDFFLALATIFSVVSTIVIVSQQAKDYGASTKVASVSAAVSVETLDC
ncbi:MAG: hypothetical protein IJL92_01755 [Thermoguttaceae bacterium]|nr:hypothetical protein [Thermoguttaceae bacterium]